MERVNERANKPVHPRRGECRQEPRRWRRQFLHRPNAAMSPDVH